MAAKKNPSARVPAAASSSSETPVAFEAPQPFDAPPPFEPQSPSESHEPFATDAAFMDTTAASAPEPVNFETPASEALPAQVAEVSAVSEAPVETTAVVPEVAEALEAPVKSTTLVQEKMREMFETGLSGSRGVYSKAKSAADEANSALETSFTAAKSGVIEINAKVLEALRAGAEANFDFVRSILGVKSVADYVALHGEFARRQFETMSGQSKEIATLAQKFATEAAEPIKAHVAKAFKIAV